jgi:hypothetical protein
MASWGGEASEKQRSKQQQIVLDSAEKRQEKEGTGKYRQAALRGRGCVKEDLGYSGCVRG